MTTSDSTNKTATCTLIKLGSTYEGAQGLSYFEGISTETVGSSGICMHLLTMPPGARAHAHLHENHETAIYLISGQAETWYGDNLENYLVMEPGDMLYIPAGVPHLPANPSDSVPATAVIARTDPNEQESVVLRPDLESRVSPR